MKLIIKQIRFWNFMSFGNAGTTIDLNVHGTTLIVGKNGAGKSSAILDSVSFVLFNKPFRDIRKPQLSNSINGKNCLVEIDFSIGGAEYTVRRGIKPDIFEIVKNGVLIPRPDKNADYQSDFEKTVLRVNHKTFCQIVMLGSAIFTPFMALKTPERRGIIEDLLDLKIFSLMNSLLSEKVKTCNADLKTATNQQALLQNNIMITKSHIDKNIQNNDATIDAKNKQIGALKDQVNVWGTMLDELQDQRSSLDARIGNIDGLSKKFEETKKIQYTFQERILKLGKEISFLHDHETCPECKQLIDEDFRDNTVNEKTSSLDKLKANLEVVQASYEKTKAALDEIVRTQRDIQRIQEEIRVTKANITSTGRMIHGLLVEIDKLQEVNETVDISELEATIDELNEVNGQVNDLEDDRAVMGMASLMLKDTGIKAQIIKTYIPIINTLIAKYLAALDFFVSFELDENFNETIKSRFRDDFSYMSFSEGEKCRLNIAMLFAWRAISKLRGSIDCNLIVLDEIFDSSLDGAGVEEMLKLLNNLTDEENVFIISHREDQISDKFNRVIRFAKSGNFSEIVE